MAEQGWLGILIPENFGGQGLGAAEMAVVVEELARTLAPEPVVACAVLAATVIGGKRQRGHEDGAACRRSRQATASSASRWPAASRSSKTEVTARKSGADTLLDRSGRITSIPCTTPTSF